MNKTILIIDDEKPVRLSIEDSLSYDNSYKLIFAENGREGLAILREHKPILILLDLKMPVMDGLEFLNTVRLKPADPYSIIVLTGHGNDDDIKKCYDFGINSFLRKPFNIYELIGQVRNSIVRKSLEKKQRVTIRKLKKAITEIKNLSGLLPICASCKKIRNDKGYWEQVESYIQKRSEAQFTHCTCPDCTKKLYPNHYKLIYPDHPYEDEVEQS